MKLFFKRALVGFSLLLIAATVTVVVMPASVSPAPRVRAVFRPVEAAFGEKKKLNILLLGVDYNYDSKAQRHTKGARSDTILIVRVEPTGKHLSMVSLPRDLLVPLGKNGVHGYDRINAAYSYGGEALAVETVEELTGLEIDHHVVVKSDVVADLVDTIGGVPINVEKQMDWDDNWAGLHIHLKPGQQILSGEDAVGYCRFRQDEEGDFGRIERQQKFLAALLKELKRPEHWDAYPKLARVVRAKMKTDLKDEQLLGIALIYRNFPLNNLRKGRPEVEDYIQNGAAYLILAPGEPKRVLEELFPPLPDPSLGKVHFTIQVERAEHLEEARRVAQVLKSTGFTHVRVKRVTQGASSVRNSTLSFRGGEGEADLLRQMFPQLPLNRIKTEGRPEATLYLRSDSVYVVVPTRPE